MRDPNRIDEVLEQVRKVWRAMPEMRLGQLVTAGATLADELGPINNSVWLVEDDKLCYGLGRLMWRVSHPETQEVAHITLEGDAARRAAEILIRRGKATPMAGNADEDAEKEPPQDE